MNKTFKIGLSSQDKEKMSSDILKQINGGVPLFFNTINDIPSDVKNGLVVIKENNNWYYYDKNEMKGDL